jgi:hypothetical protein
MGFLTRFLPRFESHSFGRPSWWEISPPIDSLAVLDGFRSLVSTPAIMTIEGVSIDQRIADLLSKRSIELSTDYKQVISWPRPKVFHVDFSEENVGFVISEARSRSLPAHSIFNHLQIHWDGETVLQWFDYPFAEILISPLIPTERIKDFCSRFELVCEAPEAG